MNKILVIDDDRDICVLLKKFLEKKGFETDTAYNGKTGLDKLKKKGADLVLVDFKLPDESGLELLQKIKIINSQAVVIIITGYSDVKVAVKSMKLGAYDYVTKPLHPDEILMMIKEALSGQQKKDIKEDGKSENYEIIFIHGESPQATTLSKNVDLIAPTDMTVIILGETGTGKEFVAREIHNKSKKAKKPFVAVDCGALPENLAGSELFGHVKGAFTGAISDKKGSFEYANKGTLFLDEIGNLTYENQMKMLRVLQERKIKRLGSNKDISVDVRIIVASNEDLFKLVKEGKFREDLYHRLNEFKILLSPLRERKEDIMIYAEHFLKQANNELDKMVKGFDKKVKEKLKNYYWHGNLRELRNVVKRSVLLADNNKNITLHNLPDEIISPVYFDQDEMFSVENNSLDLKSVAENAERKAIINVLEKTGYNKTKAADVLKIDRKTLYNKMRAYKIDL